MPSIFSETSSRSSHAGLFKSVVEAFEKVVAGLKPPLVEPDADAFVAQPLRQRFARIGIFAGATQKGVVLQVGDILS